MEQNGGAHRTRSHIAKLLTCKRERPGEFSVPKKQQQRKSAANAEGRPPSSAGSHPWHCPCPLVKDTQPEIGESSSVGRESH